MLAIKSLDDAHTLSFPGREHPGAAAAADGDREAVPEAPHRHPGAGAAGPLPGHAGERQP